MKENTKILLENVISLMEGFQGVTESILDGNNNPDKETLQGLLKYSKTLVKKMRRAAREMEEKERK